MKKPTLLLCCSLIVLAILPLAAADITPAPTSVITPSKTPEPTCTACPIVITGNVTNAAGTPIVGANINYINGNTKVLVFTDNLGSYTINSGACGSSSTMTITATRYAGQSVSVTTYCGNITRDFVLAAASSLQGDVNDDQEVTIVDALITAQYSVGLSPVFFNRANSNVNCDTQTNILDALMIAQYYVHLITQFPCTQQPTPQPTPRGTVCPCMYSIHGTIFNAVTGEPVAGAFISLFDERLQSSAQTASDATGYYSVAIPADCTVKITLTVTATGYTGANYSYEGSCGGGVAARDFNLQPAS